MAAGAGAAVVLGLAVLVGVHLVEKAIAPPVPGASMLLVPDYQAGDCLYASVTLDGRPWPVRQWRVPCGRPHAFEVFSASDAFWPASAPYPGERAIDEQAGAACDSRFDAYDHLPPGLTSSASTFRYVWIAPLTSADWARGGRELDCVAFDPAPGSPGQEATLTYSIRGTGQ